MDAEERNQLIKQIAQWVRLASENILSVTIEMRNGSKTTFQIMKEDTKEE